MRWPGRRSYVAVCGVPVVAGLYGEAIGVEAGDDAAREGDGCAFVDGVDAEFDDRLVAVHDGGGEGDVRRGFGAEGPADVVRYGASPPVWWPEGHGGVDRVVVVEGGDVVGVVVGPAVLPGVGEALGGCSGVHGSQCGGV